MIGKYYLSFGIVLLLTGIVWLGLTGRATRADELYLPKSKPNTIRQGTEPSDQSEVDRVVAESLRQHVDQMLHAMSPSALQGYRALAENVYLPADFDDQTIDHLKQYQRRSPIVTEQVPATNDRMRTMAAYGVSSRPDANDRPLQYVVTKEGRWVMNCMACHGGRTYGVSFPGAPNTSYALESLTEDVRRAKLALKLPLTHMDVGSLMMPLGSTVGTSNAVMFGVTLLNYRDSQLNIYPERVPSGLVHHDMDAPAWWHFRRKSHIYIDGFAEKSHRGLMQFMLVKENGPEQFAAWESDFVHVYQFLSELTPPKYPLPINKVMSERGRAVYAGNCAACHGARDGSSNIYPELNVAIQDVATDPVRHEALTRDYRQAYAKSWFADFGKDQTVLSPGGYTAPPLDGVWATAPYLHNGSVPTLRAILFPELRPIVWRRTSESFNADDVGFMVQEFADLPAEYKTLSMYDRRWFFDTRKYGKSSRGHDYPTKLSVEDRNDLLEFLKTL